MRFFRDNNPKQRIELFDTHCHLDFDVFDDDRKQLIDKSVEAGIQGILVPGTIKDGWRVIRQIAATNEQVYSSLGLHPMFLDRHEEKHLKDLEMAVSIKPLWAVGEIGLDYFIKSLDKGVQNKYFRAQLSIAKTAGLPVILHVRKAHDDVLRHLRTMNFPNGGFVHAFNGTMDHAKRYADFGFKLGFGGAVTYPRAIKLRDLLKALPLSWLVLETDAPDMRPLTCESDRNTPLHLLDNFKAVVALREESAFEVAEATTRNARTVLNLLDESEAEQQVR